MKIKNINEKFPFVIVELEDEEKEEKKYAIGCLGVRTNPTYNNFEEAEEAINKKNWETVALLCEAITRQILDKENGNN